MPGWIAAIEFERAKVLAFGLRPIPVVKEGDHTERRVCLGQALVELQRLLGGGPRLGEGILRRCIGEGG